MSFVLIYDISDTSLVITLVMLGFVTFFILCSAIESVAKTTTMFIVIFFTSEVTWNTIFLRWYLMVSTLMVSVLRLLLSILVYHRDCVVNFWVGYSVSYVERRGYQLWFFDFHI